MTTLADELLNDFGEDEEGEEEEKNGFLDHGGSGDGDATRMLGVEMDVQEDDDEEDEKGKETNENFLNNLEDADSLEDQKARVEMMEFKGVSEVRSVTALIQSLQPVLERIAHFQSIASHSTITRLKDDDPEYKLLLEANTLYASIDTQIVILHKFIRDHYTTYPELETLITGPIEYATAVAIIGNGPLDNVKQLAEKKDNILKTSLQEALDKQTLMIVTTEAVRTHGKEMSATELRTVNKACEDCFFLDKSKNLLSTYVQSRMSIFAPNVSALVGSRTAALLINACGGLTGLASTPNRNLPSVGSKKQFQAGFARNVGGTRQRGFLYHSELFRSIREDDMKQAQRIVSAKVVLAARIDLASTDSAQGEQLRLEVMDKLEKIFAPPENRGPRALPAPDDKPSRKRGGRKIRKLKEATASTALSKARNRMAFNQEEQEVGYGTGEGTVGMGMVGQDHDGQIRALKIDQRTKAKLSKKNQKWGAATPVGGTLSSMRGFGQGAGNETVLRAHGLRSSGVGAPTSGTATSIAFTPVQGLELVNPEAQKELKRKREAEDDRWFKGGTFTQIGGASAMPSTANGGFKVPPVPAKAKTNGDMGPPPAKKAA